MLIGVYGVSGSEKKFYAQTTLTRKLRQFVAYNPRFGRMYYKRVLINGVYKLHRTFDTHHVSFHADDENLLHPTFIFEWVPYHPPPHEVDMGEVNAEENVVDPRNDPRNDPGNDQTNEDDLVNLNDETNALNEPIAPNSEDLVSKCDDETLSPENYIIRTLTCTQTNMSSQEGRLTMFCMQVFIYYFSLAYTFVRRSLVSKIK